MLRKIVDISHHNVIGDWKSFYMDNDFDGLMIRCGHGSKGIDKKYESYIENVAKEKIPFGIYLYFDGDSDGKKEMERLIKEYRKLLDVSIPPRCIAIDYEVEKGFAYVKNVLDVLEVAKKDGIVDVPVFWYSGMAMYNSSCSYLDGNEERIDNLCEKWIARYNSFPPNIFCTMWQHTSSRQLKGCAGGISFDESYISEAAYQHIFIGR